MRLLRFSLRKEGHWRILKEKYETSYADDRRNKVENHKNSLKVRDEVEPNYIE